MLFRSLTLPALLLLAALPARATEYPLTLRNCGMDLSFDKPPGSVVTAGQATTEILYSLGLADKVTATSVWFTEVLPEFTAVNAGIERLADNDPSLASVLAKRPDLVTAQYQWHIGPQGNIATRERFAGLGIPTWIMPTDCQGADQDADRGATFSMDSVYQSVTELAQIFDVEARGRALVAALKTRETAAIDKARALELRDTSALFWFSSADMDLDPYVAGRKGPPAYMMRALGLRNIIESDQEWPMVSWRTIARADPSVIVLARMERRRYPADDVGKKLEFLRSDPDTRHMQAVRQGRIVVLDAHAMDPSIRVVAALEELARILSILDLH